MVAVFGEGWLQSSSIAQINHALAVISARREKLHAISGPALAFGFKEEPEGSASNIVSDSVFFTKLLMRV